MSSISSSGNFFSGESSFSAQLNNVVSQAVARATLPITELQDQQSTLTNQQTEVQTLGSDFVAVQSALGAINSALGTASYSAAVDTPAVATASVSSGALAGSYSLDVTSLGSRTNTISGSGSVPVSDPSSQNISSASSFSLSVDGQAYSLSPSGTSLNDLVSAINASGANVQATVVNVGGSASPDYRLSVESTQYSPDTIQLTAGSTDLLTSLNTGSFVTYQINGQPSTPINSTSRSLSISTGVTADVLAAGTADITVSQSSSNVSNAITSFVSAYNTAAAELTKNRGQNGGALSGDSLISNLESSLNSIGSFSNQSSSSVKSLADIGLTFDQNGNLDFDSSKFDAANSSSPSAVSSFLGSETTGGFVEFAYNSLNALTNSTNGVITATGNNIGTSISALTSEISTKQAQVTQLQTTLTTQMAEADSAISALQGQLTEITGLFSAENQVSQNINGSH